MGQALAIGALLGAAFVVGISTVATGQAGSPTPEGTEWQLVSYFVDGGRHRVPAEVTATLPLLGGRAVGGAGCNGFAADYRIDGESITITTSGPFSDMGCGQPYMDVEEAYMALLPTAASWAIDGYYDSLPTPLRLVLSDMAGDPILEFVEPDLSVIFGQVRELIAVVDAQQTVIERLRERIRELEQAS
jgi:heat shock protein HslJ